MADNFNSLSVSGLPPSAGVWKAIEPSTVHLPATANALQILNTFIHTHQQTLKCHPAISFIGAQGEGKSPRRKMLSHVRNFPHQHNRLKLVPSLLLLPLLLLLLLPHNSKELPAYPLSLECRHSIKNARLNWILPKMPQLINMIYATVRLPRSLPRVPGGSLGT